MQRFANYIESQYREIASFENIEYLSLYESIPNERLKVIFSTLQSQYISLFKLMNERLPTTDHAAHFWAEPSRELIQTIEITNDLLRALKNSPYSFFVDDYYLKIIHHCETFLSKGGGSSIPPHTEKVELYYTIPIFVMSSIKSIDNQPNGKNYQLKLIGEGSYAKVFKYFDDHYQRFYVVKRALNNLNNKELIRFRQEFEFMNECNSPYIVEVYNFDAQKNEYTMEFMDSTLQTYIKKNNTNFAFSQRKIMGHQVIKAFEYIHSKGWLHRDISPNNILLKTYDDTVVLKISDFGLVKNPELQITSINTEFKGWFNDPALVSEGFNTYSIVHETYALTKLLFFILTGKTNPSNIKNESIQNFVNIGLNKINEDRFQSVQELKKSFSQIQI